MVQGAMKFVVGEIRRNQKKNVCITKPLTLYSSPNIISYLKSKRLRWARHVARMEESRNEYRVLVGRPEGERPLERRRCENNIKKGFDGSDL